MKIIRLCKKHFLRNMGVCCTQPKNYTPNIGATVLLFHLRKGMPLSRKQHKSEKHNCTRRNLLQQFYQKFHFLVELYNVLNHTEGWTNIHTPIYCLWFSLATETNYRVEFLAKNFSAHPHVASLKGNNSSRFFFLLTVAS